MSGAFVLPPRISVIETHKKLLEVHGGAVGIRDEGGIDAALARGDQLQAYEPDSNIFQVATAISFGFIKIRHPFADGNKRIGFAVLFQILFMNGYFLDAAESEATAVTLDVASGEIDEAQFALWVKGHSTYINP